MNTKTLFQLSALAAITLTLGLNSCTSSSLGMPSVFSYSEIESQQQSALLQRIDKEARSMRVVEVIPATATSKRQEKTYILARTEAWTPVIQRWLEVEDWYATKQDGQFSASFPRHEVFITLLDTQGKSILYLDDAPKHKLSYEWSNQYDMPTQHMHRDLIPLIKGYPRLKAKK